jgi:tetratricopeptide (TPR) repeat protein
MWIEPIDKAAFMAVVAPALNVACAEQLATQVEQRWRAEQLCSLLSDESAEVRRVACVVLGLTGRLPQARCLAAALRDEDPKVNTLAEQALWSIFFRSGRDEAMEPFKAGLLALEMESPAAAVEHFGQAHEIDGEFAEALNQRAIAWYMMERYEESLADCRRTVEMLPIHFGALAGMGHCHAQQGNLKQAAAAYRQALAVNPSMDGIAALLSRIEQSGHPATSH